MSISEDVFQQLNASKHAVKVPESLGRGRMALFETIHQIHCVVSHDPSYCGSPELTLPGSKCYINKRIQTTIWSKRGLGKRAPKNGIHTLVPKPPFFLFCSSQAHILLTTGPNFQITAPIY